MYYILILVIIISIIFYILNKLLKNIEKYENNNILNNINNITIILTSTVNVNEKKSFIYQKNKNERMNTYLRSISQWLHKTKFNIVLVENSGYNFDELNTEKEIYKDRFEVISFKENELDDAKYLMYNNSKGASEIFAINYAFNNSRIIKNNNTNFIIKITARYFIPELENYLLSYNLNYYDCLTQNNRSRCEMIGSHIKNFQDIFNPELLDKNNNYDGHIENIWKYRTMQYDKVLVCKEFNIESTQRGGLEKVFVNI
jgi:hypothetical protein